MAFLGVKLLFLNKKIGGQQGFTLIELCIAMILLSAILLPMLLAYERWERAHARSETSTKLSSSLYKAYSDFFYINSRYPCPANPSLVPGDPQHGREDPALCTGVLPVYSGSIPFADLNIPYDLSLDGWNNQFFYAVSPNLVVSMTAANQPGVITVNTYSADNVLVSSNTTAQLVLLSLGKNGAGAVNASGVAMDPCPTVGVIPWEQENCNGDNIFRRYLRSTIEVLGPGLNYYDDVIWVVENAQARIWATSGANEGDIFSRTAAIGIGTNTPIATIDVVGNIRSNVANSNLVCDQGSGDCFDPEIIGGTRDEMNCGVAPMVGVRQAEALCGSTSLSLPVVAATCGTGYLLGLNADGTLQCGFPVGP